MSGTPRSRLVATAQKHPSELMLHRIRSLCRRITRDRALTRGQPEERRVWGRLFADRPVKLLVGPGGSDPLTGLMKDLSRGGIRLEVNHSIDCGAMIRVELPLPESCPKTTVLACVVHVGWLSEISCEIGCSFSTELSDGELEALGARRASTRVGDKRAWERLPAAAEVVYHVIYPNSDLNSAEVHNISPTGVALFVGHELTPGSLLNLELKDRAGRFVLDIVACVVYLSAAGPGRWMAGCNFIRALAEEDFQAMAAPCS